MAARTYFLPPQGLFTAEGSRRIRADLLRHLRLTPHTAVVTMNYRTVTRDARTGQEQGGWRRVRVVVAVDRGYATDRERDAWIRDQIRGVLEGPIGEAGDRALSGVSSADTTVWLDPATGLPEFRIQSVQELMDEQALRYELGIQLEELRGLNQNALFADHEWYAGKHRSFRYMIKGCDLSTLGDLMADAPAVDPSGEHNMCAYHMLRDRNTPGPHHGPTPKIFRPERVLKFMNDQFNIQSYDEGLNADQIQQHAIAHRYPHLAMDLSRSILNFHYPAKRHTNHKSIVYVVTGDHCQPIVDEAVVNSMMKMIPSHLGVRNNSMPSGLNEQLRGTNADGRQLQMDGTLLDASVCSRRSTTGGGRSNKRNRHRAVVEDVLMVDGSNPRGPTTENEWDPDVEEDCLDPEATESETETTAGLYPLVTDADRFHLYPKADMMALVEAKCHPDYVEPNSPSPRHIHYYVTTDTDDVNFVYHYVVRKCAIDPMRYAKAYNGMCMLVRMGNIHWVACKDFDTVRRLHEKLYPTEPFRPCSLGSYATRMFARQLKGVPGNSTQYHEILSHYSPNLSRLADLRNHYNHPKILHRTFQPPYSNPKEGPLPVQTLIPMAQRRRIDFIRSYTAVLWSLDPRDHEAIPIHFVTDPVLPFDPTRHAHLPCGHYLVDIPTAEQVRTLPNCGSTEDWELWTCFPLGTRRLMSHRLLRALISRGMLNTDCIRTVCPTDEERQKRYGMATVIAIHDFIRTMYESAERGEIPAAALKKLVNHFVGCCNGTTVPRNGGRLVFRSLEHLWQLIVGNLAKDQMQRLRIFHTKGFDDDWQCTYDYHELDVSGITHRSFHAQPLWNIVLEQQALHVFDVARTIPRNHRIQIHVDAIEYSVPLSGGVLPAWAQALADATVDRETYESLSPLALLEGGYLDGGRFKAEWPKVESQALAYHLQYHPKESPTPVTVDTDVMLRPIEDREDHRVVLDWKASLRPLSDPDGLWASLTSPLTPEVCACTGTEEVHPGVQPEEARSGCLITGPAGTGKTRALRQLVAMAQSRGDTVILTAYTHAACVQMGPEAQTLSSLFGIPLDYLVRSYLCTSARCRQTMANIRCDWLVVDEISLIPGTILELLMVFHRMHSQTRIVLVGDFNQLPPIESRRGWDDNFDYFTASDIFPYLCYDRQHNVHGHWLQLTECHRTDDPILKAIAENPQSVTAIAPEQFPPLPSGMEMWRFLSMDNRQRKACNFYCMVRFQQKYPVNTRVRLCLRDLWVDEQWRKQERKQGESGEESDEATCRRTWSQQFDGVNGQTLKYRPSHWQYLQNYTYVVGMPVACRHTLRDWRKREDAPVCVNNRRAHIVDIDTDTETIVIRWDDEVERHDNREEELETLDVRLKFYDFAFHFVPAFCTTIHWCQGETIREHYGVMDWNNVRKNAKAAYVAVTRGSSAYLHLMPYYNSDPWNVHTTSDWTTNLLRELYNVYCWNREAASDADMDMDNIVRLLESQENRCARCTIDLKLTGYLEQHPQRFRVHYETRHLPNSSDQSASPWSVWCHQCLSHSFRKSSNQP